MLIGAVLGAVNTIGGTRPRWTGLDQVNKFVSEGNWSAVQQIADSGVGPWNPGDPLHRYTSEEQLFARNALARRPATPAGFTWPWERPTAPTDAAAAPIVGNDNRPPAVAGPSPVMLAALLIGAVLVWKFVK